MLEAQRTSGSAATDRWRWPVLGLALAGVVFWAASYSWLLGLTPPTRWVSATASPWLVMEVAAVATGAATVLGGVWLAARAGGRTRRTAVRSAWLGAFVLTATVLSLLAAP